MRVLHNSGSQRVLRTMACYHGLLVNMAKEFRHDRQRMVAIRIHQNSNYSSENFVISGVNRISTKLI